MNEVSTIILVLNAFLAYWPSSSSVGWINSISEQPYLLFVSGVIPELLQDTVTFHYVVSKI
jgi:hypothetical protein